MIGHIELVHYLDEKTYKQLGSRLGMDMGKKISADNQKLFTDPGTPMTETRMYTISYSPGPVPIWFLYVKLDFNALLKAPAGTLVSANEIAYGSLRELLMVTYRRELGDDFGDAFPRVLERSLCSYVEFVTHIQTPDADRLLSRISGGRFKKEQLDIDCFDTFKLKNATPSFSVNRLGRTVIRLCAKCYGTALKRLLKATNRGVVVPIDGVLDKETAVEILSKQVVKHLGKDDIPDELSRSAISDSI